MSARSLGAPSSLLLILLFPGFLQAQSAGTPEIKPASTVQTLDGKMVDQLPVDRLRDALILLPGVGSDASSGISIRGGRAADAATYLDGVPVSPGYRKMEFILDPSRVPAPGQTFLEVGTNTLSGLEALTGPLPASFGRGQAGIILLETRTADQPFEARASLESDRPFGSLHGPGLDRLQAVAGGQLMRRLRVAAFGAVEGRESQESGPGAPDDPIFVSAGVDTTVAVPSAINDPVADTVFVDVYRFAIARGRCETASGSTNPDIARNYGEECRGVRIPATGSSTYQLLGKLDYAAGERTTLRVSGAVSRDQRRYVDPGGFTVPPAAFQGTSRMITLGARHQLQLSHRPFAADIAISFQRDQAIGGPLSPSSALDTQDGFLLTGMEFLYDFTNFPVNQQLINNIRNNVAGSRRSPLDLENSTQYSLINRYRNSPYGLDGGPEAGGPSGRLTLLRENRTVGLGSVEWQVHRNHALRAGIELTRYSLLGYSHNLVSQALHDAFIADPSQSALYIEDQVRSGNFALAAGVRYDRFRSDAERPFVLDTVSSSPTFGTYSYFPTPSSYGNGSITFNGQLLVKYVADEAKSAVSPRLRLAFAPGSRTTIRVGFARQVQMPDLSLVLSGINTDLRVTNTNHVYGNDLDLERTTLYEIGLRQVVHPRLAIDASLYSRELDDQVVAALQTYPDPSRLGAPVDIRQMTSLGLGRVMGLDLRADLQVGRLRASLGYSFQDADREFEKTSGAIPGSFPLEDSRPHTLSGILALELPATWGRGTIGTILRNTALYSSFRFSSGTPYTRCPAGTGNESALSGEVCVSAFAGDFMGARLPSTRHLDLRITRGLEIAGHQLIAYLDGRNILNFENILRVYAVNGRTSNPVEAQQVFSADSAGFADVGFANGINNNGDLDLTFGGAGAGGCGNFVNSQFTPAAPDCVYLIRAEERYGDGDHVFTVAEQRAASDAAYRVVRGRPTFLGAPRRIRAGLEVRF